MPTFLFLLGHLPVERLLAHPQFPIPAFNIPLSISIAPPVKALAKDQVHYLNGLGPRGLSAFNLLSLCERCCEAIKTVSAVRLVTETNVSCFLQ